MGDRNDLAGFTNELRSYLNDFTKYIDVYILSLYYNFPHLICMK